MKRQFLTLTLLLPALALLIGITGCEKEEEDFVVEYASWYFGTWTEDGTSNTLYLSETDISFSSGSSLQRYGSSFTWYDSDDEGALAFFYGDAGATFQGTVDGNSIPDFYYIDHEGEKLIITERESGSKYATYTRGSGSGGSGGPVSGKWERHDGASYLKFSGSSVSLCNGSTLQEFNGTYDSSINEATLTEGSTQLTFKITPEGNDALLIEQWVSNNHVGSTYYYKSTEYPCD